MQYKNIVAVVLVTLLVFHKQLNININHLIIVACLLTVLSVLNRVEGFDGETKVTTVHDATNNTSTLGTYPVTSPVRTASYAINSNINAPSNIGFSGDTMMTSMVPSTGYDGIHNTGVVMPSTDGLVVSTTSTHLTDDSGNIWTTSNLGVDGDARVKGSQTIDVNQTVKGALDVDGMSTLHNDLMVMGNTTNVGTFRSKDDGVFEQSLTTMGPGAFDTTLTVNGDTSLKNNLDVVGGTRLRKTLQVDGDGVVSGSLGVNGMTTLTGNADVSDDLTVNRDVTIGGRLSVGTGVGQGFDKSKFVGMADSGWGEIVDRRCPDNHFMCGLRIRHEFHDPKTGSGNSGVNGMSLQCCPFK